MSILVVDLGTSGVRAAVVRPDGRVEQEHHLSVLPDSPAPGLVEFDAAQMASAALEVAARALADGGPVDAVGIANQRASTVVWERSSGRPVAPALGWQDLRTVGTCLELQGRGLRVSPNESATKLAAILDAVDPDRRRAESGELAFGTVDTWAAWTLSEGALHVTDATNAGITGLMGRRTEATWDTAVLEALRIPEAVLPTVVDSSGALGPATALAGDPLLAGMAGDQQASLMGQGCTRPGLAKATFGTGGMLDQCTGRTPPAHPGRSPAGTFSIVAWRRGGQMTWGIEAVMLSAGTCVEWLRDDLGVIATAAESAAVAAACEQTDDVWFVPALLGLGTPVWDFGARGALVGLTRGSGRAAVVRAVLEGVAHRGADLLEAAELDSGLPVPSLRVDGGMSDNDVFVQALADACGRVVEIAPVTEATTLGAAYLAGMAVGTWA
ncbi:MAG: glycerol kinase, partial [Acidimicrobiales bacterium]|nr:glycerol kinase [Acidimicrobiales bacterium]